jgi:hypothetical protein
MRLIRYDRATREVEFNGWLHAFSLHCRFHPRACAPFYLDVVSPLLTVKNR